MAHSSQVREFVLGDNGIDLVDAYLGVYCVLTGTARMAQETQELAVAELRRQNHERKLRKRASKQKAIEAQIAALQAEAEAEVAEVNFAIVQVTLQEQVNQKNSKAMAQLRGTVTTNKREGKRK